MGKPVAAGYCQFPREAAPCVPVMDNGIVNESVVIWHQKQGAELGLFEAIIARHNAAHPDASITAEYFETEELRSRYMIAALNGAGPDLVYGPADNVGHFVSAKTILPLEQRLPARFFERCIDEGIVEWRGSRWLAADQLGNHLVLVYDRQMVARPPESLDELVALGQALTRDGVYGLAWNYREPFFFIPFLTGFGGWVMDDHGKPTLNTPEIIEAMRFVLDLRDRYRIVPKDGSYDVADELFKSRHAAMTIDGAWSWVDYGVPERSMIAPLPKNTQTNLWCAPMVAPKGYSVSVNVPEAKWHRVQEALDFLTGDEVQQEFADKLAIAPVNKQVIASPSVQENAVLRVSMEQIKHGRLMPVRPRMREIWEAIRGAYHYVLIGVLTPEKGAELMQRQAEESIVEAKMFREG